MEYKHNYTDAVLDGQPAYQLDCDPRAMALDKQKPQECALLRQYHRGRT